MEHIPRPEEKFEVTVDGYNFKILTVENKMITQVLVTRQPDADDKANQKLNEPKEENMNE